MFIFIKWKLLLLLLLLLIVIINVNSEFVYDRNKIKLLPGASLQAGSVLPYGHALATNTSKLYVSEYGYIILEYKGNEVWRSDTPSTHRGMPFTMSVEDSFIVLRDCMDTVIWRSATFGLGALHLTLFEEGDYNRKYGLVLVNSKFKMVWGRMGALRHQEDYLIPGSFLDVQDKDNHELFGGEFITNGRDYFYMGKDGVAALFTGNPNGDANGAPMVFRVSDKISPTYFKYSLNFEGDGYLVVYSSSNNKPIVMATAPGTRYIHLPPPDPTYSKNEWSIIGRDVSGKITWGQFSNPEYTAYPDSKLSQSKKDDRYWLQGAYVRMITFQYPYNYDAEYTDFFLDVSVRCYFTEVPEHAKNNYIAIYGTEHKFRSEWGIAPWLPKLSFDRNGNFMAYVYSKWTRDDDLAKNAFFTTPAKGRYSNNYFILYNQFHASILMDCSKKYCGVDSCGCRYLWSDTYNWFKYK